MIRPLNPARTITAPYSADHPPPMPDRIRALLGKRAADLTRRDLLDIAADAANRDPWDLCGDREHVGAICDLAGTLEAEFAEALLAAGAEVGEIDGLRALVIGEPFTACYAIADGELSG